MLAVAPDEAAVQAVLGLQAAALQAPEAQQVVQAVLAQPALPMDKIEMD